MTARASYVEVYKDRRGEFRWRFVHWNGNVMADSAEGYDRRIDCIEATRTVCGLGYPAAIAGRWKRSTGNALRWYR